MKMNENVFPHMREKEILSYSYKPIDILLLFKLHLYKHRIIYDTSYLQLLLKLRLTAYWQRKKSLLKDKNGRKKKYKHKKYIYRYKLL